MAVSPRPSEVFSRPNARRTENRTSRTVALSRRSLPVVASGVAAAHALGAVKTAAGLASVRDEAARRRRAARVANGRTRKVAVKLVIAGRPRRLTYNKDPDGGRRSRSARVSTCLQPKVTRLPIKAAIRPADNAVRLPERTAVRLAALVTVVARLA